MKKLFTTLALCAVVVSGAFAQACGGTTSILPHSPSGTPGLTPSSDSLAPGIIGVPISDTIYFENYTTVSTFTVNSLQIDSINNLPTGLCWETSAPNNTFSSGQTGVIYVHGTSFDRAGQYKLVIYISILAGPGNAINLQNQNAEALTGSTIGGGKPLRYYVRLDSAACGVQPIDTVRETNLDSIFFPYTSCPALGINELANNFSNLTVVPNPFSSSANMTFTSSVEGTYTVKMVNMLGATMSSKEVNIVHGENTITTERNNLSAGMYLLSISNAQGSVTRKVIIE